MIAPILVCLLGAAADLGTATERSICLVNAASAGAQYAVLVPNDPSNGAASLALSMMSSLTGSTVTVVVTCQCPVSTSLTTGPAVDCSSTCPTGMAQYITVTATAPFTPIFPLSGILPFDALGATTARVITRIS